jgi:hypothetical protein
MGMRDLLAPAVASLMLVSAALEAQEIVEVPASKANVARPDDLFALPPGQWHMAKLLSLASPCVPDQCEAGFTSGDLVVSVEHSKDFVRIIAGFRACEGAAYSEVEVGSKPGKPTFGRVSKQIDRVLKGLAKTCKTSAPTVPKLEVSQLFPKVS